MIQLLGVDPGFASVGLALVRLHTDGESVAAVGVIRTEKSDKKQRVLASDDNTQRGRVISRELRAFVGAERIHAICAESMSFPRNSSAAAKMAICWGILINFAEEREIPILQASPQQIKIALCRRKDASKEDVQSSLDQRYPFLLKLLTDGQITKSVREHPYDAVGAVVACLQSDLIRGLKREF